MEEPPSKRSRRVQGQKVPVHGSNPTEPGGTVDSDGKEPQGKDPGATQPVEDMQRSIEGSNTDFHS